jgi:hypothetical protein
MNNTTGLLSISLTFSYILKLYVETSVEALKRGGGQPNLFTLLIKIMNFYGKRYTSSSLHSYVSDETLKTIAAKVV